MCMQYRVTAWPSLGAALSVLLALSVGPAAAQQSKPIIKAIAGNTQTIDPRLNLQPRGAEMVANMYDQLVTYETFEGPDGQRYADVTKPVGLLA